MIQIIDDIYLGVNSSHGCNISFWQLGNEIHDCDILYLDRNNTFGICSGEILDLPVDLVDKVLNKIDWCTREDDKNMVKVTGVDLV